MAAKSPKKYYHTNHGPEIFSRRLAFTPEEKRWRKEAISFLSGRTQIFSESFSADNVLREHQTAYKTDTSATDREYNKKAKIRLRARLIEILKTLRVVNEILKVQYGSPDWGNQPHVIDELVYILLTRRSKIEDAGRHLAAIRERYTAWEDVAFTPPAELKAVIMGGGLEDEKVKNIQSSLQVIYQEFGRINEADFTDISDENLDKFLLQLPGIGPKSAACILMYARDADIFPADTHCIRILNRLGLFASFGFEWNQTNHKQAEKDLLLLIPPHMRSDLHRNLLALGREICKKTPLCDCCELKKFCNHYRQQQQAKHAALDTPTAIDMFCGAGGFSLGLQRAGFKVVAAIDNNPDAIRTYRLNHPDIPDEAIIEDAIDGDARKMKIKPLRELLGDQQLDLLVGGPPCQGYSMMGNRVPHKALVNGDDKNFGADYKFTEDKRNHLFKAMLKVARFLKPHYVLIENVPGLGSANIKKEKSYAKHIAERLEDLEYQTEVIRLEAVDFYVPQNRHRYFILGVRQGEQIPDLAKLGDKIPDGERTCLEHALYDLPELSISDGSWIATHSNGPERNTELDRQYLTRFETIGVRGDTTILFNHVSRYNNEDDVELYSQLRQGETYRQLVERLTKEFGKKPHFTKYSTKNFHDKYYRLQWNGQSKTIVSHLHKDGNSFVHPTQTRSISVREAARIQSFPDDYIFCGSRGSQFIQIGNAVPPVMAYEVGRVLMNAINRRQDEDINE